MNSTEVRRELVDALTLDLVGPTNAHAFAAELLPESPSRWYLAGFLVPADAPIEQRADETAVDEIDSGADTDGVDDGAEPSPIQDVELGMEVLGNLHDGAEAATRLMPLVKHYRDWIQAQRTKAAALSGRQLDTANDLMVDGAYAATRIE